MTEINVFKQSLDLDLGYIQDVISIVCQFNTDDYFLVNICGLHFFIQVLLVRERVQHTLFILVLQQYYRSFWMTLVISPYFLRIKSDLCPSLSCLILCLLPSH